MTKLTISFPDDVAMRLRRLRNSDEFVRQAVEKALEQGSREFSDAEASRWRLILHRVKSESISLGDYYPQFKKDLNDLRED